MTAATDVANEARDLLDRMGKLRTSSYTDMFSDLWIQLHEAMPVPGIKGEFESSERGLFTYMMLGEHGPIDNPLDQEWDLVFKCLDDQEGPNVRATPEARKLSRLFAWPAMLIADEVARRIAKKRVLLGIASQLGIPSRYHWERELSKKNEFLTACAWHDKWPQSDALVVVDRSDRKIYIFTNWKHGSEAVQALRNMVADSRAPEHGYYVEWHVAIFRSESNFALLDDPWALLHCLSQKADQLWFVGKGQEFNDRSNLVAKDPRHLMTSALEHAEAAFQGGLPANTDDELRAWKTVVDAAETYLERDAEWIGVPSSLLKAMGECAEALAASPNRGFGLSRDLREFVRYRLRSDWKPEPPFVGFPERNDPLILPPEILDAELARYAAVALERSTPQPVAADQPAGNAVCPRCGRTAHQGRCRF